MSSGNISQTQNYGVVPQEVNLNHGKRTQRGFGSASSPCLPPGFHICFQEQALRCYEKKKKYFMAYYSSETEKGRAAFVVVCMERCSKQGHSPV